MSEYEGKGADELEKIIESFTPRIHKAYQAAQKGREEGVQLNRLRDKAVAALKLIKLRADNPDLDINLK